MMNNAKKLKRILDRNYKECYTHFKKYEFCVKKKRHFLVRPFHRRMLVYLLSFTPSAPGLDSPGAGKKPPRDRGRLFAVYSGFWIHAW
jgi:hypothetical protein